MHFAPGSGASALRSDLGTLGFLLLGLCLLRRHPWDPATLADTVAILAQGTNWAVAVTQAFFPPDQILVPGASMRSHLPCISYCGSCVLRAPAFVRPRRTQRVALVGFRARCPELPP